MYEHAAQRTVLIKLINKRIIFFVDHSIHLTARHVNQCAETMVGNDSAEEHAKEDFGKEQKLPSGYEVVHISSSILQVLNLCA
jgi:hypothetical protein